MNDEPAELDAPIHLTYTLSSREIRRAWWPPLFHSPILWVVWVLIAGISAILLLLEAIASGPSPSTSTRWLGALVLFPFLLLTILSIMFLFAVILIFALSALASRQLGPQELVIDDAGVISKMARAESRIDWKVLPRALELGAAYSLRKGKLRVLIPKRAFETPASEEQFRALCAKHCKTKFRGASPVVPDGSMDFPAHP